MRNLQFIYVLVFILFISSCVPRPQPKPTYPVQPQTDISATAVVTNFLEAIKSEDFSTAYDQLYFISSDKEGYINGMKNFLDETGYKLLSFKILGTQLFKNSAIVVAELEVLQRSKNNEVQKRTTKNRYDLAIINNEWKLTKDGGCIENCEDPSQR